MIATLKLTLSCGLLILAARLPAGEIPPAGLIAHFRFDGDGLDENRARPAWNLTNTKFDEGSLYLNGWYDGSKDQPGYRAMLDTPGLNPKLFSIVLRLRPAKPREGAGLSNIISASNWFRWFSLGTDDAWGGRVLVKFNNGDYSFRIERSLLRRDVWTVLTCTVDIEARQVAVYQDGQRVGRISLPGDFVLDVLNTTSFSKNNVLTFTDYSGGKTFTGWIDEMLLYNRVLSEDEVMNLPLLP